MKHLCIQIQPHRAAGIDTSAICSKCEALADNRAEIKRFAAYDGTDEIDYINLMFESRSVAALWKLLQQELYGDEVLGPWLLGSSIAMCQGDHGWDDYLLLHHFDAAVKLDQPTHD